MNTRLLGEYISMRCGIRDSSKMSPAKVSTKEEEIINKLDELILVELSKSDTPTATERV